MDDKRLPRPLRVISDFVEFVAWIRTIGVFVTAIAFLGWGNNAGRLIGVGFLMLGVWFTRSLLKTIAAQSTGP